MNTKGHRKIRKVDIKDDHVRNKVWKFNSSSTFTAMPPHPSNEKANNHACIETEAEMSKLNGILIAGERHCIKFINKYNWLVVKGNLKGC